MPGRIFISYRRDDVPGDARGLRDGLAARFGKSSIFMDVDNLLAGQRFDEELAKALQSCEVFLAVIGPRWMEQLAARTQSGERDYVREEIAAALRRRIVVIPVRVGREGQMPPLPRAADLPEDIRDLVHYQKQDVAHERFGRDIAELVSAIRLVRQGGRRALPWRSLAAACALLAMLGGAVMLTNLFPLDPSTPTESKRTADAANTKAVDEAQAKRAAEEAERKGLAMLKAEEDGRRSAEARIAGALQHWQRFRQSGNTETYVSNGDLAVKEFFHSCFARVTRAKISDLNISAAYTKANPSAEGNSWVYIPCRDARTKCVSTDFGSIWLAKDCETTSKVERETKNEFVLSSIPHADASAIVARLLQTR